MLGRFYAIFVVAYLLTMIGLVSVAWALSTFVGYDLSPGIGVAAYVGGVVYAGAAWGARLDTPPSSRTLWGMSLAVELIALALNIIPLAVLIALFPSAMRQITDQLSLIGLEGGLTAALVFLPALLLIARWLLGVSVRNTFKARERSRA